VVVCATISSVRRLLIFRLVGLLHRRTKFVCLWCRDSSDGFSLEDEIILFNFLSRRAGVFSAIFTHNPDGEYGHPQHRKLSQIASTTLPLSHLNFFPEYNGSGNSSTKLGMESMRPASSFLKFLYCQTIPKAQRASLLRHFEVSKGEFVSANEWFTNHPIKRSNVG